MRLLGHPVPFSREPWALGRTSLLAVYHFDSGLWAGPMPWPGAGAVMPPRGLLYLGVGVPEALGGPLPLSRFFRNLQGFPGLAPRRSLPQSSRPSNGAV